MTKALASRLRQRVTILREQDVPTGRGGYSTAWVPIASNVSAEVLGLTGSEAVQAKVLQGISVYRITIRWRSDVRQSDQLRYGADDLNITSAVDPDGRREQLVILAESAGALATG